MADETIYPFGQGGSIPSGYPIADDLTTASAQQALSAKQGTVIRPYIMGGYNSVDLSGYTVYNGSLGTVTTWYMTGKHITVAVTPGEAIKIRPTGLNGHNGGLYGFLKSSHSDPVTSNTVIAYANGTSRAWIDTGVTEDITVPSDAAYLCLCVKDGAGETSWEMWTALSKSLLLNRSEIVDNLTAGGEDVPLSARQGVVLAEHLFTPIPPGLTKYTYTGEAVNLTGRVKHIAQKVVASVSSKNFQGGACYGDILFMFTETNTTCWVFDLSSGTLLQTISIPSADRGFVSNCHCNTVNFGTEFYNPGDTFPLLYVSTGYNDGTDSGVLVYRIIETTVDDVTTYSLSLVQTVKIPGTGWTEFVVGDDGNCFVCYTGVRVIYRMDMPKLSDGDFTFDLDNALEVYKFTPQSFSSANQNRIYRDGKIYVVSGAAGAGLLIVLDLVTRTRCTVIDLNAIGITKEPETCFFWNGNLCVACRSSANVFALYFD